MIADQAQALRGLVEQQRSNRQQAATAARVRTMAITSGKGGVGKTTFSVNLAAQLARMHRRVLLLDADLGTANADVLCNLAPVHNLAHVVAGRRTIQQAILQAPGGFELVPGASGLAQMAALGEYERDRLLDQLQQLEHQADVILIDTGAGIGPNVLGFLTAVDEVLVVVTPEPTAITDAYALIKTLVRLKPDADVRLVVNMVRDEREAKAVFARIAGVCRRFLDYTPRFAGCLVSDPRVSLSIRRRQPFVLESPGCPASRCMRQLAHRLDRHVAPMRDQGLFRRMARWFGG